MQNSLGTKQKSNKKKITVSVIAVILAAVVAAVSVFVYRNAVNTESAKIPFTYYTEDKLFVCKSITKNTKSIQITDRFAGEYKFSSDGEHIVYTKNKKSLPSGEDVFDIYVKKVFEKNGKGTLVAKGATAIVCVTEGAEKICFEKDGNIYVFKKDGKSSLLQKENKTVCVNVKTKTLLTSNGKSEISLISLENDKVQVLSEKVKEYAYNPDLSSVYFTDGENLYSSKVGSGNRKIEKGKSATNLVFADGKLYYILPDKSYNSAVFVEDNCEKSDVEMKEPDWNDYLPDDTKFVKTYYDSLWKTKVTEPDVEAYDAAYREAEAKFEKAMKEYRDAKKRVKLRKELKKSEDFINSYALYSYGGIRQQVSQNVKSAEGITLLNSEKNARVSALTLTVPFEKMKKIDIKKINSPADVEKYVLSSLKYTVNTVSDSKISEFCKLNKKVNIAAFDAEKEQYIVTVSNGDGSFDLYGVKDEKALKEGDLISKNCQKFSFVNGKTAIYDSYNENEGYLLHFDKKEFAKASGFAFLETEKTESKKNKKEKTENLEPAVFIATDYDEKTGTCDFYKYENSAAVRVAKNVDFSTNCFGKIGDKIIYIESETGNLVYKQEDETHIISEKVKGFGKTQLKRIKTY